MRTEDRLTTKLTRGGNICPNGHKRTQENTGVDSKGRRKCIDCRRASDLRKRARMTGDERERVKELTKLRTRERRKREVIQRTAGNEIEIMARINENRATLPWNYNKPKATVQLGELNKELESQRSNCFEKPNLFTDYEEPPQRSVARAMCVSCPVFDLCATWAAAERPAWGIYAGEAWEDGKKV